MSRGDAVLVGGIVAGLVALAVVLALVRGDLRHLDDLTVAVVEDQDDAAERLERLELGLGGLRAALPDLVDAVLAERDYVQAAMWPTSEGDRAMGLGELDDVDCGWVDDDEVISACEPRELAATGTGWPA